MLMYLCDDSESDTLRLKHYLNKYAEEKNLHFKLISFSSAEAMLASYRQAKQTPTLIFLDIYMACTSGMEAARQLRSLDYQGGIIFTTSSTEHAMDSYEVNALYYLQKPYERRDFENAMARCSFLPHKPEACYTFTQKKREISVPYDHIIFFETSPSHTVALHTVSGVYSFHGVLTQIRESFREADNFLPIGRSFLINRNHVAGQLKNDLIMSDGSIVQIPLRKQAEILATVEICAAGPIGKKPPS